MTAAIVAILGAESSGKTTLAAQLADALRAHGVRCAVVAEYLREFCDTHGRTPRQDEQGAIADEQWRRIEAAALDADVVIADTTPLMTAIYSDFVFGDAALYPGALARQARCALTLVTGLDLPWQPDGLQRDGPQVRAPIDAKLRAALDGAGLAYALVYGEGEARLACALRAVQRLLPRAAARSDADADADADDDASADADADADDDDDDAAAAAADTDVSPSPSFPLRNRCRECLQADCEHRLFEQLPRAEDATAPHRPIRSYVLRAGRIGPGQARALAELGPRFVLPFEPRVLDTAAVFGRNAPVVLEIGFGMGDATAQIAAALPGTDFIGCEVHEPGVGALLRQIGERGLMNLRIVRHDAVQVLETMIAPGSLAGIHVFFPDPWHKKKHNKRRLIQPAFVAMLATRIAPGGYLHCATDWQPYAEQMLALLAAEPALRNTAEGYAAKPAYRPLTKFEQRGLKLGHGVWDLVFERRSTGARRP